MNPEFKAEWIAALRSKAYPQGEGRLRSEDGKFCCLGVACELLTAKGLVEREGLCYGYSNIHSSDSLPGRLFRYLDFETSLGDFNFTAGGKNYNFTLSGLNDDGLTFDQIADVIEYFF